MDDIRKLACELVIRSFPPGVSLSHEAENRVKAARIFEAYLREPVPEPEPVEAPGVDDALSEDDRWMFVDPRSDMTPPPADEDDVALDGEFNSFLRVPEEAP